MKYTGIDMDISSTDFVRETAIVYVLNSDFLRCTKVLHYSMIANSGISGCDVIVITDDPLVAEDKVINRIASGIELLSSDDLKLFSGIKGDRIDPNLKTEFAPKYTFLKLFIFKKRKYKRHIFIDGDMLCLGTFDVDLLGGSFDTKAASEIGASIFPVRKELATTKEDARKAADQYVSEYALPLACDIPGINSGFVVLQGPALSDDHLARALELSAANSYPNEQSLTTDTIRSSGLSFLRLPLWYNARRRMFASQGQDFFDRHRQEIVLMHYTPGKPWKMTESELRPWDRVWLDYEDRSLAWQNDLASSMV